MRIFFIGDYKVNTGPSNVNKNLIKHLPNNTYYIKRSAVITRIMELIIKTILSKVVIISGFSVLNIFSIYVSKLFGKKVIYLLHGIVSYENKINGIERKGVETIEQKYLKMSDCILCVSENFKNWFIKEYKHFENKTSYLNNGIEWDEYENINNLTINREPNTLITMGGGRPQKNNLIICEAINLLNRNKKRNLKLIVLGRDYRDTEKIKSYDFVDYIGQVSHEEAYSYLRKAQIFVQNSYLESFGLAAVEALVSGCDILLSQNIGAISVIGSIEESDIINDCTNPIEIAQKIEYLLENANNKRLLSSIDRNATSYSYAAKRLLQIVEEVSE